MPAIKKLNLCIAVQISRAWPAPTTLNQPGRVRTAHFAEA